MMGSVCGQFLHRDLGHNQVANGTAVSRGYVKATGTKPSELPMSDPKASPGPRPGDKAFSVRACRGLGDGFKNGSKTVPAGNGVLLHQPAVLKCHLQLDNF